jgi:hypothetical protein
MWPGAHDKDVVHRVLRRNALASLNSSPALMFRARANNVGPQPPCIRELFGKSIDQAPNAPERRRGVKRRRDREFTLSK